jgi:hypothetical protein
MKKVRWPPHIGSFIFVERSTGFGGDRVSDYGCPLVGFHETITARHLACVTFANSAGAVAFEFGNDRGRSCSNHGGRKQKSETAICRKEPEERGWSERRKE